MGVRYDFQDAKWKGSGRAIPAGRPGSQQIEGAKNDLDLFTAVLVDNLCRALRKGCATAIVELKQLVMKGKITAASVDEYGCSALQAACQGGLLPAVINMIQKGFDFKEDEEGNTPLHVAYLFGHDKVVEWLECNGANPEAVNKYGIAAKDMTRQVIKNSVFLACKMNSITEVISAVSKEWILVDETEEIQGRNLFLCSAERGHKSLMSKLIMSHANINAVDLEGNSALHLALANGHVDVGEFLLERGADSEATNYKSMRPRDCFELWKKQQEAPDDIQSKIELEKQCKKAAQLYSKSAKRFLIASVSKELTDLRILFDEFCSVGTKVLGVENVRAGRSAQSSRANTMDYVEFRKFLQEQCPETRYKASKTLIHFIFKQVAGSGDLSWLDFLECLHRLASKLGIRSICKVPLEELASQDRSVYTVHHCKSRPDDIDSVPLQPVSIEFAKNSLETMQRQMNAMASRAKDVTACKVFLRGPGLTTGKHTVNSNTLDVYSQLLTFPQMKLKIPAFQKSKDNIKRDFLSKSFFTEIDQDKSGTLTSYELRAALDDYGFTGEEQTQIFDRIDSDNSGVVSLSEFVQCVSKGDIQFVGRVSRSKKQDSDLKIAMATSKSVEKRAQPDKILSLSPGLFGQIFRIYHEHAMKRLSFFEQRSCIYRAPHLSAVAQSTKLISKSVLGINTRFAAVNPFDSRVLAAFTPNIQDFRLPCNFEDDDQDCEFRPSSSNWSVLDTARRPHTAPLSPSSATTRCTSTTVQSGSPDYKAQLRAINPGLLQGLSPSRRKAAFGEPELTVSPDGKLLSEHTRITLIPHRLSISDSGQLIIGGVETDIGLRNRGTIALQAVKRHKVTLAGLTILNRILFRSLSTGSGHCAGVSDSGLVFTWGQGRYGQLGHGDDQDRIIPQPVDGIKGVVKSVSAGFYHTIAVTKVGTLFTWGDGREGKLGHNDDAARPLPTLVTFFFDQGTTVSAAEAGGSHSAVLTNKGQIFTFGAGQSGRLGHGNDLNQQQPMLVAALEFETCVSIAAGFAHTAAVCEGKIYTWGSGRLGRLGHGTESDEVLPRRLELGSHASIVPLAVAAGEAHTCVYQSDGSMVTLGRLTHGRYAQGCITQPVETLTTAMRQQSADDWYHFSS